MHMGKAWTHLGRASGYPLSGTNGAGGGERGEERRRVIETNAELLNLTCHPPQLHLQSSRDKDGPGEPVSCPQLEGRKSRGVACSGCGLTCLGEDVGVGDTLASGYKGCARILGPKAKSENLSGRPLLCFHPTGDI
jgi:hypothetical protein